MPYTFNGFGSRFSGRKDVWPDGSYLTSEWFVIFLIPLIRIRTLRVRPTGAESMHFIPLGYSREFQEIGIPPQGEQANKDKGLRNLLIVVLFLAAILVAMILLVAQG